jgi:hypothetical protein
MRRFEVGETVVRREVLHGEIWFGYASICVRDDGDLLATYLPPGTPFGFPLEGRFPAGRHPWEAAGHREWSGHGLLALHWADVDHAIFVFWRGAQREFTGWYFNLQDAPRRTEIGFDTLDHELDLVWPAGAPSYEWKDVELFAETGELRYPGRVAQIQAEGDRIAALLDSGERWWDEGWANWRPDPAWTPRRLREGWTGVPFQAR